MTIYALASRLAVITNRAPTTALHALASSLAVLAVVELSPNALGVHGARRFFTPTLNVFGLLPPRAAEEHSLQAQHERQHRDLSRHMPFTLPARISLQFLNVLNAGLVWSPK